MTKPLGHGRLAFAVDASNPTPAHVADPTEPVPVTRLCAELGLSRRSLEYLFDDTLGISPAVYFKRRRLNGVRAALLRTEPERGLVKRLALDWGFWHLGHFARDYRNLFGESPVRTLGKCPDCQPRGVVCDRFAGGLT